MAISSFALQLSSDSDYYYIHKRHTAGFETGRFIPERFDDAFESHGVQLSSGNTLLSND